MLTLHRPRGARALRGRPRARWRDRRPIAPFGFRFPPYVFFVRRAAHHTPLPSSPSPPAISACAFTLASAADKAKEDDGKEEEKKEEKLGTVIGIVSVVEEGWWGVVGEHQELPPAGLRVAASIGGTAWVGREGWLFFPHDTHSRFPPSFHPPQDLGTTYSCVGVYKGGRVEIVANDQGNRITPSYVAFTDGERLIGDAAKNQATTNPERTVYDVKRLIGRKFAEKEVQRDLKLVSYKVVEKDKKPYVQVSGSFGGLFFLCLFFMRARAFFLRPTLTPSSPPLHPTQPTGQGRPRPENLLPRGSVRHDPDQDEGDGGSVPRQTRQTRCCDRARLLQRRPTPGHQGRGHHRGAQRGAHHQ